MSMREEYTPTASSAGVKGDASDKSVNSSVYNTCAECPVYAYRDAVCNDNLRALVVSGNPTDEELAEARDVLSVEFAELTGNMNVRTVNISKARIMALRCRVMALSAAVVVPDHPNASELFRQEGWGKLPVEQQVKRAEAKIKELTVRLNRETAQAAKRQDKAPQRLTEAEFNMQMVVVSKWVGFHLSDRMTLAELAGYIKAYKEYINLEKNAVNNKKY